MNQLCQIVDENDELIGFKPRNEIDFKKDYYRIGCLWLTNLKGEVLLAQRLLTKDKDPGKWGPSAAGTLEKGETYESNIYKEAEEELGLTGVGFTAIAKLKLEEPRKSFLQLYEGVCDWQADEFTPQPEEVEQVSWIHIDDLRKDIKKNPDKYVPSIKILLETASK
ncbi:MAG: NUDIX domain-containing protein [bacterium]|nr:NUDIX domain-containing protein [bacterium]